VVNAAPAWRNQGEHGGKFLLSRLGAKG